MHVRTRLFGLAALIASAAPGAAAQQFPTDSPGIRDAGGCAVEPWGMRAEQWLDLACTVWPGVEWALDAGIAPETGGVRPLLAPGVRVAVARASPGRPGAGLDVGLDLEAPEPGRALRAEGLTLAALASYELPGEQATLYGNAGWARSFRDGPRDRLVLGTRLEVPVGGRAELIGEVYAEGRDVGAHGAVRAGLVPERLAVAVGVGRALRGEAARPGLTLGVSWTPPRLGR